MRNEDKDSTQALSMRSELEEKRPYTPWWKEVTDLFDGFSIEYLLDTTTDWSFEPYTHMFIDHSVRLDHETTRTDEEDDARQEAIHRAIKKRFKGVAFRLWTIENLVFVNVQDAELLQALWRSPLICGTTPLKLVYRGLPIKNATVWSGRLDNTMTMLELGAFCKSYTAGRNNTVAILAKLRDDRQGEEEGPFATGDLLFFCSDLSLRKTPKMNGKALRFVSYARVGKDGIIDGMPDSKSNDVRGMSDMID
ncbi:Enoyl-CoA hydratase/isomerase [Pseudozyma hubeiensis]|nr:Enoyl-CoA hydratase/isomerase [Pseudozyma hubeiensis]